MAEDNLVLIRDRQEIKHELRGTLFPSPLPFPLLSLPFSPVPLPPSVFPSPLAFFLFFYPPPLTFFTSSTSTSCSRAVLTKSGHHCYHLRRTENRFPNPVFPYLWKMFEFDPNLYISSAIQHHRHFALAVTQAAFFLQEMVK